MANKKFPILLHAGRGKRKGESSGMICNRYKYLSFFCEFLQGFRSSVGRARDFKSIDKRYETRHHQYFFLCKTFFSKSIDFEMSFWYLQFFEKTNEKIWFNYYGTSSRIVFSYVFLEETPKIHLNIN